MSKQVSNLFGAVLVMGFAVYGVWAFYTPTVVVLMVLGLLILGTILWHHLGGNLWSATPANRRRRNHALWIGVSCLLLGMFFWGTGREQLGKIGAALIVLTLLVMILVGTVGGFKGSSKK